MRKQFQKFKEKADNLVRPRGTDRDTELRDVEARVDRFKKVLRTLEKKILPPYSMGLSGDSNARKTRCAKLQEYNLGVTMEELVKELPETCSLRNSLDLCGKAQKILAETKVNNDVDIEEAVYKELARISEHIATIQKQKSVENKCASDFEQAKNKYSNAKKAQESSSKDKNAEQAAKIDSYKDEMDECETRLDKERDIYACCMYDLLAEEEAIIKSLINFVHLQEIYYAKSLQHATHVLGEMKHVKVHKKVFGVNLQEHLNALISMMDDNEPGSDIAFVIEYCVCFLLEKGFQEEGLFRVGHTAHKLSRLKSAIDAGIVNAKNLPDIQDPHVIAALLKNYLRSLPEPLLTYDLYKDFIAVANLMPEQGLKQEILRVLKKLPKANYDNLRYLMAFFSDLKEQISKTRMTTQNIAIVISPNLLWSQNEKDQSYSEQVSSTAAVNTIVEQLVSDYSYFFGTEPVCFYKSLKKPVCKATNRQLSDSTTTDDNGGFISDGDRDNPLTAAVMSQSMGPTTGFAKTHTPRSSDGTNQIQIQNAMPRTGSNNSMSDSSSPPQRSPRPLRRNKNKAPAPTPTHDNRHEAETQTKTVFRTSSDATPIEKHKIKRTTSIEDMRRNDENNVANNPLYGYHTISRSSVREKPSRPSPAPRNSMRFDDAKIYANFDPQVTIREKPAIPERPANLPVRPSSISRSLVDHFKAESSPPAESKRSHSDNDYPPTTSASHETQLERIQSFSIDKQQVAIIDIGGSNGEKQQQRRTRKSSSQERSLELPENAGMTESNNNSNNFDHATLQQVPPSPREGKNVKRPQVPAPPPPTIINPAKQECAQNITSDSTNL
ncbi:rho GTPase-activating protein 92B-like [Culicoides brevitarsis]|uniref:rho GTPase-activating protein 92B-like n=1 Tax=Culicoides brevitarsis TaxID=469753 RepID=UPI00307C45FD